MLVFSALPTGGEQVALGVRHFATRLAGKRGDAEVLLAAQAVRAVALGVAAHGPGAGGAGRYRPRPFLACRTLPSLRW
ncbi:hypothetical protein KIF59_00645 [Enterobacter cloacae subsp. cloacae]|nr:hypothetical protein [Enterobacter cloacae subsp. cloacae]